LSGKNRRETKEDDFTEFASHMALVHNIIIRGYNSMYLQAPKVKAADAHDFLHYCQAWYEFVVGHHDSEESVLFPGIEKATGVEGIMDGDVQEHGARAPLLPPSPALKVM
jgi:hemerythrin-like domain-containing protein